jgi:hypothetical protein
MKSFFLSKRVDELSMKLVDEPKEHIARFDADSFTEPEKLLFRRIEELQAEHGVKLPPDILEANKGIIFKAQNIIFKYCVETFRFSMHCFMDADSQRDKNLFDLFFYSFMLETKRCLKEAQQTKTEEEYFDLMDKYDFFRKLASFADKPLGGITKKENDLEKTQYSEEIDNEHYDPYYRI